MVKQVLSPPALQLPLQDPCSTALTLLPCPSARGGKSAKAQSDPINRPTGKLVKRTLVTLDLSSNSMSTHTGKPFFRLKKFDVNPILLQFRDGTTLRQNLKKS